jgi:hypothetical protein
MIVFVGVGCGMMKGAIRGGNLGLAGRRRPRGSARYPRSLRRDDRPRGSRRFHAHCQPASTEFIKRTPEHRRN